MCVEGVRASAPANWSRAMSSISTLYRKMMAEVATEAAIAAPSMLAFHIHAPPRATD